MASLVETSVENGRQVLRLSGSLTLARSRALTRQLDGVTGDKLRVDLSDVDRMDTVGAWLIHKLQRDRDVELVGVTDEQRSLIDNVAAADRPAKLRPDGPPPFLRIVVLIGQSVMTAARTLVDLTAFLGLVIITAASVALRPRRLRWHAIIQRFEIVGVHALAIVGLMSFLVGIVIAQQGAIQLQQFGAELYTINLVGRVSFRELGVLMTAIMVAGRSGSAFAAEIGSMKLAEEVDAMRTIGVSPMEALVLPRVIATTLVMPLLAFFASMMAILGGMILVWAQLEIQPIIFVQLIRDTTPINDVLICLIKAPVFGMLIAVCGCFQGMQVKNNAEEVGFRTTAAVVQGIFLVIVLDAFFAVFFSSIGWI
ncbi:MAG TPA: MlaE family lipid ABC transporter permease subunit [Allosphingosinicella sp.]|jgi:phospholipid/cholesterol/gamma-HCH transport system permease protein|nr:MlaE family lipid ABC transporter permease subunit [Allosphingosinicella sp.]